MSFELPQEVHEIDGVRFKVTKLPFKLARPTLLLLSGRLLPAAKAGAGAIAGDGDAKARAATALLGALSGVFETLTEAELEKLDEAFGSHCEYYAGDDPKTGEELWVRLNAKGREQLFSGGRMALYAQWLVLCGRVNFSDFFGVLKGLGSGRTS
jgi:hypothetical protein